MLADQVTSSVVEAKISEVEADIASNENALHRAKEQMECDEQRMHFLLHADACREDFYEIRSLKKGEVRRIVINGEGDIVFESESTGAKGESSGLPEFDEIDEKYLQVIQDNPSGRSYFKRLRGRQDLPKIPNDLPSAARRQMRQEQRIAAQQEARQLRQAIVDNFRQVDCLERESEIQEILLQCSSHESQKADLNARQAALAETLKRLQETLLEARAREETEGEAQRKAEHDCRRQAWFERLYPTQVKQDDCANEVSLEGKHDSDVDAQSEASTAVDEG
eukprot:TRINITY_DN57248_c0_g1_i1.p1 TRINITY_DN57248_c0_g1~~TRINITY_DN57248_c0_g1_i1.p1  ORF type:complete len:299 (-),score=74.52 TRINITY_DN57248_c0_g1_i1:293-1132(-)